MSNKIYLHGPNPDSMPPEPQPTERGAGKFGRDNK